MIKRVLAAAFALSLLGGESALAQQGPPESKDHSGEHSGGVAHGGGPGGPAASQHGGGVSGAGVGAQRTGPIGGQGAAFAGAHGGGPRTAETPHAAAGGYPGGVSRGGPGGYAGPGPGPGPGAGARQGAVEGRAAPGGRGSNPGVGAPGFAPGGPRPRYNAQDFPRELYPEQRFHWRGEWRAPPGFYYRHWIYGDRLPWGWYDRSFWITDYYDYDLPVPPFGFDWIRLGPDAVLVDLSSGMVVETVYGAFY